MAQIRAAAARASALLLLSIVVFGNLITPSSATAQTTAYYVESTGHVLAEPFLTQWMDTGGIDRLGLPVTDQIGRDDRLVQYFEYGALYLSSPDADEATQTKVGNSLLAIKHRPEAMLAGRRIGGDRNPSAYIQVDDPTNAEVVWDGSTRHSVRGMILDAYNSAGGADRFGAPLSEAFTAYGARQQWFEYGRIVVQLPERLSSIAAAGLELANAVGADTSPSERGSLPLFDLNQLNVFAGDGTVPEASGQFVPIEILIPAIGVDAYIEQIGISNGAMETPADAWNVGWYPVISYPGTSTNVVMSGHRDWWDIGPTVFYDLAALVPGHRIYLIAEDGTGGTYEVSENYVIDATTSAGDVIGGTDVEILTLITCDGAFDGSEYESRRIVRAVRI